ncbi:MAG: TerB family tellurite resistance protein [Sphingobacteriales bacterium]|nr:TerB family tellurite resistance protein [Sphingobacteriales bacterium]
MKRLLIILGVIILTAPGNATAQSAEVQQLLLNIQKLAQLKKILSNMKTGYQIVSGGYNTIKDISKGNFNLHQTFLDGLMQVSPAVRKYKRIGEIISMQSQLVKEYKSAFRRFEASNLFNANEMTYMKNVYSNLFNKSLQNLEELSMIVTAGKLRMSDDERLNAIDRIFHDAGDKLIFLRTFNKENNVLAIQRGREMVDTEVSKKLNGL